MLQTSWLVIIYNVWLLLVYLLHICPIRMLSLNTLLRLQSYYQWPAGIYRPRNLEPRKSFSQLVDSLLTLDDHVVVGILYLNVQIRGRWVIFLMNLLCCQLKVLKCWWQVSGRDVTEKLGPQTITFIWFSHQWQEHAISIQFSNIFDSSLSHLRLWL